MIPTPYQRDSESLHNIKRLFVHLFSCLKTVKYLCQDWKGSSQVNMVLILLLAGVSSVLGHGGVVWPPIWQDGEGLALEEVYMSWISTDPPQVDPKTGREIDNVKSWSTDQAYTYGHGQNETLEKTGPHTNNVDCTEAEEGYSWKCARWKHPWAAPGRAPNLGGGCGIHGGNPYGCPAGNDTRPPGSVCPPDGDRGTWSFGSSALEIEFPEAKTTKWSRGSEVPVGFLSIWHGGGYTYRLCKMPAEGKAGLTEECFTKNVLKFAGNKTFWRRAWIEHRYDGWEVEEKTDLTVGTYPEGSAWREQSPYNDNPVIFKDHVVVPEDLEPGDYVLGWRWDAMSGAQVWVSCANIEII